MRCGASTDYLPAMRRLALFARHPEIGKVKTRLSPALPPAAACTLYRGMLADAIEAVRGSTLAEERFVYWAEAGGADAAGGNAPWMETGKADDAGGRTSGTKAAHASDASDSTLSNGETSARAQADGASSSGADLPSRLQSAGDLGARLAAALGELLVDQTDRAVILGADCPALDARVLDEAFARLEHAPLVLAPARDGGYALIGLGRQAPALFGGIEWSTDRVLDQTLARAREAGLEVAVLGTLEDVDTAEDLCALVARAVTPGAVVGAHTREALRSLGLLPPAF
jgi:rSAM/selenodomain-associated transferase 1